MKKVAFFVQLMLCGGVENSLITLSERLRDEGHQVTIYVIQKTGAFPGKVPDGVLLRQIRRSPHSPLCGIALDELCRKWQMTPQG